MFSTLRNRFGIPGVISVIALVFAMFGGAYAASNSSGGKSATASAKKAAKGPRGPKGATGPAGAAGAAGPAGPAGAKGDTGAAGSNGEKGATGASGTGKSVVLGTATGAQCDAGGITVEVEGSGVKKPVCNGEQGLPGNKGSAWVPDGTLPENATETGTWAATHNGGQPPGTVAVPISFAIPLAAPLAEAKVHMFSDTNFTDFDEGGSGTVGCAGAADAPSAPSGHLCVYGGLNAFGGTDPIVPPVLDPTTGDYLPGASKAGGALLVIFLEDTAASPGGAWAVTG